MFPAEIDRTTTLSRADDGVFSLASIDLAPFAPVVVTPYDVNFTRLRQDGAAVTKDISVPSASSLSIIRFKPPALAGQLQLREYAARMEVRHGIQIR